MTTVKTKPRSTKSIIKKWLAVLKDRGIKQSWLAERVGLSDTHLSNIFADRAILTPENHIKINEVLGTDF